MSRPKPWEMSGNSLAQARAEDIITPSNDIAGVPLAQNPSTPLTLQQNDMNSNPTTNQIAPNTSSYNSPYQSSYGNSMGTYPYSSGSAYGSTGYGSSMYGSSGYGSSMYGGRSLYGGGGMYGGRMGMGGYGNNPLGDSAGFLDRLNQHVYSLCDIAQLLEQNATGLFSFFGLIKNFAVHILEFSKKWLLLAGLVSIARVKQVKEFLVKKLTRYFWESDLSREELSHQVKVYDRIMKYLMITIFAVNLIIIFKVIKRRL